MSDTPSMTSIAPRLPNYWRELLARERTTGYPDSLTHQLAYRNFVHQCFPAYEHTTDPVIREQLEAWWILTQLPYDGVWQYWLTAPADDLQETEGGAA